MRTLLLASTALLALSACSQPEPPAAPAPAPPPSATAPEPAPAPVEAAATQADAALEDAIRATFPDYRAASVDGLPTARYLASRRDLNGDGSEEVIVYLMGPFFCGTGGCSLLVFTRGENGYTEIANAGTARPPVSLAKGGMNGYADIWYEQSGGGGPTEYVQLAFQDGRYGALSRAPANEVPASEVVIAGDADYSQGTELTPAP